MESCCVAAAWLRAESVTAPSGLSSAASLYDAELSER